MRMRVAILSVLSSVLVLPACQLMPEATEPADHELRCGDRTIGYSLAGDQVLLHLPDGKQALAPEESASGALYRNEAGDTAFWSKGNRVTVTVEGERLPECRHSDRASLAAPRWRVRSVEAAPVPEEAQPVTLNFMAEGRVSGRSGCNHFMAAWEQVGDRLVIARAASTRMACPSGPMAFEERFLAVLSRVEGLRMAGDGTLVLLDRESNGVIRASATTRKEPQ
ncbi:META domain-containing protein [Halomonadaceae bacterium KBTZ08]